MTRKSKGAVMVTGGAGFIGSHLVRRLLADPGYELVLCYDLLTYAADRRNLAEAEASPRFRFVQGDVCDGEALLATLREGRIAAVVHCAAESHVDRSIADSAPFLRTNVLGTQALLDAAREAGVRRLLHVSTDEVYGPAASEESFDECAPLRPGNPYAASKAAADLLCLAYRNTHGFPVLIARPVNNYGPEQFPEKFIPRMILRGLRGQPLPVFGDGLQQRSWMHVSDTAQALALLLEKGREGEIYNLSAGEEAENLRVAEVILAGLGASPELLRHVDDRPGHDRRYALNAGKIRRTLGWSASICFAEGLRSTLEWYRENAARWECRTF